MSDVVVLLHGMGRTKFSMTPIGLWLTHEGFDVLNVSYPSTKLPIPELVEHVRSRIDSLELTRTGLVHFVTHSLGGIIVRMLLSAHRPRNLGRIVMLGPPNQGSEVADVLASNMLYQMLNGPAGQSLGTDSESLPNVLGPVDYEVGVIAGSRAVNPFLSVFIEGASDGKVSVKRTKVAGMKDFLVVPKTHTFMMNSPQVWQQTTHFLRHGCFSATGA